MVQVVTRWLASSLLAFRRVEGQRSTTKHDDNITTARGTSDVANRWASVNSAGRVLPTVIDYNFLSKTAWTIKQNVEKTLSMQIPGELHESW